MNQPAQPTRPSGQSRGVGFGDIKPELLNRLDQLLHELAPGGRRANGYYIAKNPTRADRSAGSFWVRTTGSAIGVWKDEATGDGGDIIKLVQYAHNLPDNKETLKWCLHWLGWSNQAPPKADLEARRKQFAEERRRKEEEERAALANKQKRAVGFWLQGEADLTGTVIETYLANRGITFSALGKAPGAIRLLPNHDHYDLDGVVTSWPCMIATMIGDNGKARAVHRTWLAHDGSGKAPVKPQRKIWPAGYDGTFIPLAKGADNLSVKQAIAKGQRIPLVLTEGIEDGLSIAQAAPQYRVWACGTLGNIGNIPVPDCASKIIICADNDWNNPQAEKQLAKCKAMLKAKGKTVAVVHSWIGKDVNDLMKGTTT